MVLWPIIVPRVQKHLGGTGSGRGLGGVVLYNLIIAVTICKATPYTLSSHRRNVFFRQLVHIRSNSMRYGSASSEEQWGNIYEPTRAISGQLLRVEDKDQWNSRGLSLTCRNPGPEGVNRSQCRCTKYAKTIHNTHGKQGRKVNIWNLILNLTDIGGTRNTRP